ncbi:AcrR family transcriptional regulator [Agromyces terreus]|uniref:AcrR family transcriptional regulator n=1 Tax=Agromyces terreus TaxID=424795 RepID=A0A9X2GZQ4_9MICO|nr:TetR/AcrR family transcriptional regulator C-terminal domain-containing protein [Agromyces terreus]MCP2369918.1 AcrR family transcriptional regulator [Agromyces terreus]
MARPKVPLLSVERIADAALELVDSGEPFGVNALARRIGVTPSSLYNHVDGRDGIIELMRGRFSVESGAQLQHGAWHEVVAETLRAQRRMYARHPNLVPLVVGKTITDPFVIESYDRLATTLLEAGFPDDEVLGVIAIIDAFAIGFGLDLASPEEVWQPQGETATLGRLIAESPHGDERSDRAFELGLDLLLDSLRLRLARHLG